MKNHKYREDVITSVKNMTAPIINMIIPDVSLIFPDLARPENISAGIVNINPNTMTTSIKQGNDIKAVAITFIAIALLALKKSNGANRINDIPVNAVYDINPRNIGNVGGMNLQCFFTNLN
ncbi:hypothetical protein OQY15_00125 [Pedobacter sp. MC2016-15]|uniref:hypothetical protein n=1 Tax=Pedobacter sp. MC2016-15 TaxID=2994473 RepID=UPI00224845FC|nr:hypothetical protein [Pedobacter sp. MC2016-15]MCX2477473.1 hypothetical protein [Pedobacter sp. MC2016-15]